MAAVGDQGRSVGVWKRFHRKDNPREIVSVDVTWPLDWVRAGRCITLYYGSDKWYPDGEYVNYYHDHGADITLWVPAGEVSWGAPGKPRVRSFPKSGAVLGECMGWELEKPSGDIVEAFPTKSESPLLCSFPNGKALFVYDEKRGEITALIEGPGLRVESRGVVG